MTTQRLACVVLTSALVISGLVVGCAGENDDQLGTEEAALKDPVTGEPICEGKKVLVCHIPPGNPANAHEICVGEPAVAAHVRNHGDPVGPCSATDAGTPPPSTDAGAPPPPSDADGPPPPTDAGTSSDTIIIH